MKREFYTVKEVAAALAISYRQTHRLLDAGELPSAYFGRLRRVPADDFDAYLLALKEDARARQQSRKVVPLHARLNSPATG